MDEQSSGQKDNSQLNSPIISIVERPNLTTPENPQFIDKKSGNKLIVLNLNFAAVSYSISIVIFIFLLVWSHGSILKVITSSVSIVGVFMFTAAIIASSIFYRSYKKNGKLINLNRLTFFIILLIWSPFIASSVLYVLNLRQYINTNRPDQATVLSLIRECKVDRVQDNGNGDIDVNVISSDPSQGAVITHGDINTLNNELKAVNNECTFTKRAYDSETAITKWLSQEDAVVMIKQCKIKNILRYWPENIQYDFSNVTLPADTSTGILLEDWGQSQLLYMDLISLTKIDLVAKQYRDSCNNPRLTSYGTL